MENEYFSFERFAEDIFTVLWLQFNVPLHIIPRSRREPNRYGSDDVLKSIVRSVSINQIQNRRLLNEIFVVAAFPTNADSYTEDKLLYLLVQVTDLIFVFPPFVKPVTIFAKTLQSLSVSAELALYLLSRGVTIDLKRIHASWSEFFSWELSYNYDEDGGFKGLLEECYWSQHLEPFLKPFISSYCIPYVGVDVNKKFIAFIADSGPREKPCNDGQKTMKKIRDPAHRVYTHERQGISPKELIQPGDIFESPSISESASSSCPSSVAPQDTKEQKRVKVKKLRSLFHQRAQKSAEKNEKQLELLTDEGSNLNSSVEHFVHISENCPAPAVTKEDSAAPAVTKEDSAAPAVTKEAR